MRIAIIGFWFWVITAYAGLVDAVAVVVGEESITLYEIQSLSEKEKISPQEATQRLISKKLEAMEVKEQGITIDAFEIDRRIEEIAKNNRLSVSELKEVLESRFISWEEYKKQIEEKLIQEELARKVLSKEMVYADEEDARLYYENHPEEFSVPETVRIVKYASPDKAALAQVVENPMRSDPNVAREPSTIQTASLNPKLLAMIAETPEGYFTPVFPVGSLFMAIFVEAKENLQTRPFEEVKEAVIRELSRQNESKALDNYFAKQRAKIEIKVLRTPSGVTVDPAGR